MVLLAVSFIKRAGVTAKVANIFNGELTSCCAVEASEMLFCGGVGIKPEGGLEGPDSGCVGFTMIYCLKVTFLSGSEGFKG